MAWLLYVVITVVAVITADQISKLLIIKFLYEGQKTLIPHVLRFTYVENRGMAFGLLADHRWVFLVLATLGIALVGFYIYRYAKTRLARVSLALIVGGGIGNMIDRLSLGYVVDFIDFCALPFWTWVFNIADAAVCVGAALFVIDLLREILRETKKKKPADGVQNTAETPAPETAETTEKAGEPAGEETPQTLAEEGKNADRA